MQLDLVIMTPSVWLVPTEDMTVPPIEFTCHFEEIQQCNGICIWADAPSNCTDAPIFAKMLLCCKSVCTCTGYTGREVCRRHGMPPYPACPTCPTHNLQSVTLLPIGGAGANLFA